MNKRIMLAVLASWAALLAPVAPVPVAAAASSPPGANLWNCRPPAAHPYPVILLHGTFGNAVTMNDALSKYLKAVGYCVFAMAYGNSGTDSVADSASELKAYVNKVLAVTRAKKVSFVGHSQGGTMPRYYIKFLGGAAKVDDLIGLAPANHGSTQTRLLRRIPQGVRCEACTDLVAGSWFLWWLNSGDESPGSVSYTNLVTRLDTIVTPYTSGFLAAAPNVTNVRIQDYCPKNKTPHGSVPRDPAFIRFAADALAHPGPANPAFRPRCSW